MMYTGRIARGCLALAVAASMGFGATQAVAAPESSATPSLRACDWYTCYTACRNKGYFSGSCSSGFCYCTPRP